MKNERTLNLSDETKSLRKSSLLSSALCCFIGITGDLPSELSFLGLKFGQSNQVYVAWFILLSSLFLFMRYLVLFFTDYIPYWKVNKQYDEEKKILLTHPMFDETDFMDDFPPPSPANPQNTEEIAEEAAYEARVLTHRASKRFRVVGYVGVITEYVVPKLFPLVSYILIAKVIIKAS